APARQARAGGSPARSSRGGPRRRSHRSPTSAVTAALPTAPHEPELATATKEAKVSRFMFTSESVTEGHPDKMCDQISDAVLDGEVGAGDQGMMFGYACDETADLMPMPIWLAHRLAQRLAEVRRDGTLPFVRPDGKTQVTIEYEDGVPKRLSNVLISTQHEPGLSIDGTLKPALVEHVVRPLLPEQFAGDDFDMLVNPTGSFEKGGPHAD